MEPEAISKEKIDQVCNAVASGYSFSQAVALAGLTTAEGDRIRETTAYAFSLEVAKGMQLRDLLNTHKKGRKIAALKGNTAPAEWMLERLFPETFGKKDTPPSINVIFDSADKGTL